MQTCGAPVCNSLHRPVVPSAAASTVSKQNFGLQRPAAALQPRLRTSRRHRISHNRALQATAEPIAPATFSVPDAPSSAETARTIVDIVNYGTLATVCEDDTPLGTYVNYILGDDGQPVLRFRSDAVHTANVQRRPSCSLFVQCAEYPARLLARATLIGEAVQLTEDENARVKARFSEDFSTAVGVDAPQDSDVFYRLQIREVFYVGGMGSSSQAERVDTAGYCAATPDPLREQAPYLVTYLNEERPEDVLRIAADALKVDAFDIEAAEMLWVDRFGLFMYVKQLGQPHHVGRVKFQREVTDERDAKSALTMLAQLAWERERNYVPPLPQP